MTAQICKSIIFSPTKEELKMKKLALALTLVAMLTVACKKAQQPQQTTEPAPAPDTTQVQPAESTTVDTTTTK
ncbi:MAG: hypothetical protein ABIM44_00675 [candidate division WOR-3 bacterium]